MEIVFDPNLAYELYAQKLTYQQIGDTFGISRLSAYKRVMKYAKRRGLPYPLPRSNRNGQYMYDLYKNGMTVIDIHKLLGVSKVKVYRRIRAFCVEHNILDPFLHYKDMYAYELRMQGLTYKKIAETLKYASRGNSHRAVVTYAKKNNLPLD
jgi:transposase-like protein